MQIYKRTLFGMIKGIIAAPFSGLAVFIIANIFLSSVLSVILGIAAAALVAYITIFSENIYFELDNDGAFRYFKKGALQNSFTLATCRIGYRRKSESGFLGNHDINLKILDAEGTETDIDAAPLGVSQFDRMFEAMEQFAVKDTETLEASKKE